MPSNWFFDYEKIARFSRARSADMNEIFASILEGFAKTNDYMVVTGNLTMTATDQRRLLIVPSGAITITLPAAGSLTAATERDIELLFGGLPTNNLILPASPSASINFNSVTVEGKSVATGQIKLASAGAYLRLRYSPSASTYVIVDQGTAPRVFGTPSSGTNIAPWVWYGDHVVVDSVTNAAITAIAMPTSKLLGRSFLVTVAAAMLSGVAVGGGSDTINGAAGPRTVYPGQTVQFLRADAGWETKMLGGGPAEVTLRSSPETFGDTDTVDLTFTSALALRDDVGITFPTQSIPVPGDGNSSNRYVEIIADLSAGEFTVPPGGGATLVLEMSASDPFDTAKFFLKEIKVERDSSSPDGNDRLYHIDTIRHVAKFAAGTEIYVRVSSSDFGATDFMAAVTVRAIGP